MVTLEPAGMTTDVEKLAVAPVNVAVPKDVAPWAKERSDTPETFPEPESVMVRFVTVAGPALVLVKTT